MTREQKCKLNRETHGDKPCRRCADCVAYYRRQEADAWLKMSQAEARSKELQAESCKLRIKHDALAVRYDQLRGVRGENAMIVPTAGETHCPYCDHVQPRPLTVMRSRVPRAKCPKCRRVYRYRSRGHETFSDDSDAARVAELEKPEVAKPRPMSEALDKPKEGGA